MMIPFSYYLRDLPYATSFMCKMTTIKQSILIFYTTILLFVNTLGYGILNDHDNESAIHIRTSFSSRKEKLRRTIKFHLDEEIFEFDLKPSKRHVMDRDVPVWLAKSEPGNNPNYTYEKVSNEDKQFKGIILVDDEKRAVFLAHRANDKNEIFYEGVFGDGVGSHTVQAFPENDRFINERSANDQIGNHIVHKRLQNNLVFLAHTLVHHEQVKELGKPLEILYPKILIVANKQLFEYLENDITTMMKYLYTFWHAVDQKYKFLNSPAVEIKITGIVIANDDTALNYVYQSRNKNDASKADAEQILEGARFHFHNDFTDDTGFNNFDAVFVMTGLDIAPIGGITYTRQICNQLYRVAVIFDKGRFFGVQTAAHELGHLLGMDHDNFDEGDRCNSYLKDGEFSIMAPDSVNATKFAWSECSKEALRKFSKLKQAECLAKHVGI